MAFRQTLLAVAVALSAACRAEAARGDDVRGKLLVEVFANSVMRGTPRCTVALGNGFSFSLSKMCASSSASASGKGVGLPPLSPGEASLRITGTLTAPSAATAWYNFTADVGTMAWVRLWVDDHRLVDEWGLQSDPHPRGMVTHALLPNVSMTSERPVTIRVDLRPMDVEAEFELSWTAKRGDPHAIVPAGALAARVSEQQMERRALQERASTGWGQWQRSSNLAQITLPHQVGVDVGVRDMVSGNEYRYGLLTPQFKSRRGPAVPVRMGRHAYDGSYSELHIVPFPVGTPNVSSAGALNFTVESATSRYFTPMDRGAAASGAGGAGGVYEDNVVVISTNATTNAAAAASNLAIVVHPQSFWGAHSVLSRNDNVDKKNSSTLTLQAGELGTVTVSFSRPPLPASATKGVHCLDGEAPTRIPCLAFAVTDEPFVISLSFNGASPADLAGAQAAVSKGSAAVLAEIDAAAKTVGGLSEAYDAMMTAIAWNVNFDPRVAVTAPVSRTFEQGFDFIFFDWDMYFLSLMGGTVPAAINPAAFDIAISNLIEVTQTRSSYGQVMNKRAASGSSSSDTNDRTEPLVGSTVVKRMYDDAQGTPRAATMAWVVQLLFPTLLRWNQWAWEERRYNTSSPDGNLLVLGSDDHLPCEGSTIGLPTDKQHCGSPYSGAGAASAILESGMDNSPMYYYAFNDSEAEFDSVSKRVQLFDCQQSALFVSESLSLQALGKASGNGADVAMLHKQSTVIASQINKVLWDDTTGIYRQVDASPKRRGFSEVISPTSFYPLIAGVASVDQAVTMVRDHLTNASEFCVDAGEEFRDATSTTTCPYALPVTTRTNKHFYDNSYWRGRTWGPVNLLTWMGLSHPKYADIPRVEAARKGLCAQSHALLMVEFRENRHVHENYNSTTGRGGDVVNSNPFYHWGANLGYIAMREAMR